MATYTGGSVTATKTDTASGSTVYGATVHLPSPPPNGSDVTFTEIAASHFSQLARAQDHGKTVDVVTDASNNVTSVTVK